MNINQYPADYDGMYKILGSHMPLDNAKGNNDRNSRTETTTNVKDEDEKEEKDKEAKSFLNENTQRDGRNCYACGSPKHDFNGCGVKDFIPRAKWWINNDKKIPKEFINFMDKDNNSTKSNKSKGKKKVDDESDDDDSYNWTYSSGKSDFMIARSFMCYECNDKELPKKKLPKKKNIKVNYEDDFELHDAWLLDSGTTVNLASNPKLVKNIHATNDLFELGTNNGRTVLNTKATIPGEIKDGCWFDANATSNVMSLKELITNHRVTFDSDEEHAFIVHHANGKKIKFKMSEKGLFYYVPNLK